MNLCKESKEILSIIQKRGPISKKDIISINNMKLTTLNRFMHPLLELELIKEAGLIESTGGRPSKVYNVNLNKHLLIGIDISRTYTNICLTNLKMDLIKREGFEINNSTSAEMVIGMICKIINKLKKEYCGMDILGIGIGMVGPINRDMGIILNPNNFPSEGWFNIKIKSIIEDNTKLPVVLDSGSNLAVLSEHYFGNGKKYKNMAYINCGVGIRTGIILSDNIVRNKFDSEDSLSHMIVDLNGELCTCGAKGCVESICSIQAIVNCFKDSIKRGDRTLIEKEINEVNYKDICIACELGDETCLGILTKAALALGLGISNYIKILDLDYIVLSGPLVANSELFYNKVVSTCLDNYYRIYNNGVYFENGGYFGQNSIAIGGAVKYFESLLQ